MGKVKFAKHILDFLINYYYYPVTKEKSTIRETQDQGCFQSKQTTHEM